MIKNRFGFYDFPRIIKNALDGKLLFYSLILFLSLFISMPTHVQAAITFDSSSFVVTGTTAATTASWSHTVGSSSNRILVVGVSATLTAMSPPSAAKSFSPATIAANQTSVMTINLTNPNTTNITNVAFTDIYAAVSEQLSTISLTTVYNTLMLLEKEGHLQEVPVYGSSGKRFDPKSVRHDHIIRRACNKIVDLDTEVRLKIPVKPLCGFDPTDLAISIYGLCSECRRKAESC